MTKMSYTKSQAMKEFLSKDPSREWFLIDGFPRNQNNLDGWKKQMDGKVSHFCNNLTKIYLNISFFKSIIIFPIKNLFF